MNLWRNVDIFVQDGEKLYKNIDQNSKKECNKSLKNWDDHVKFNQSFVLDPIWNFLGL